MNMRMIQFRSKHDAISSVHMRLPLRRFNLTHTSMNDVNRLLSLFFVMENLFRIFHLLFLGLRDLFRSTSLSLALRQLSPPD